MSEGDKSDEDASLASSGGAEKNLDKDSSSQRSETRSIQYKVSHDTTYRYADWVPVCRNQVRLIPRTIENALMRTSCTDNRLMIQPTVSHRHRHTDYFGNIVETFSIESQHNYLTVSSKSDVLVENVRDVSSIDDTPWKQVCDGIRNKSDANWQSVREYGLDSPRIVSDSVFRDFIKPIEPKATSIFELAKAVTKRIHQEFQYDGNATHVNTSPKEALAKRAGVCQDFAQVQIGVFRSIGLPARYVSGYLRTIPPEGEERLVGADESHAWVSVYAGDQIGWIDMDPTNDCVVGLDHIPIALGRDYGDVAPMRGVVIGGGNASLSISVDVAPVLK